MRARVDVTPESAPTTLAAEAAFRREEDAGAGCRNAGRLCHFPAHLSMKAFASRQSVRHSPGSSAPCRSARSSAYFSLAVLGARRFNTEVKANAKAKGEDKDKCKNEGGF